jgi:thiamine-phosphate pyrophosphorylase
MAIVDVRLNVILDADFAPRKHLSGFAEAALHGGASLLQYRDKSGSAADVERVGREIMAVLANSAVPLVLNDHAEVAGLIGADGVHLGRDDMPPALARRLLGTNAIIGRTIQSAADAAGLADEPVDYACIGGVFTTASKANADPPIGLDGFRRLREAIAVRWPALPVGAIAGITKRNAAAVVAAGADGIAVIRAVLGVSDPRKACLELRQIIDLALIRRHGAASG